MNWKETVCDSVVFKRAPEICVTDCKTVCLCDPVMSRSIADNTSFVNRAVHGNICHIVLEELLLT